MVAAVNDGSMFGDQSRVRILKTTIENFFSASGGINSYDTVIHAASQVGPAGILTHTGRLGSEIVRSIQLLVDACIDSNKPLVAFSSAEVYGRSGILSETDVVHVPTRFNTRLEYAIAKLLTECIVANNATRGLKAAVIRPFNVAGPRQSSAGGFVIPTFVQQALAGAPLTIFAGGEQKRAFLAAADLSRFLLEFVDAAISSPNLIFNLGNPDNTISISQLAHKIKRLTQSNSPIDHVDAKSIHGDLYEEALSVDKIPALGAALSLGWRPLVSLDELLRETINFYRAHPDPRSSISRK